MLLVDLGISEFSIFKAWIKGDELISCILLEQVAR